MRIGLHLCLFTLGPQRVHAGQCCCIVCSLGTKFQEHTFSACNLIYSVARHPMLNICSVHCIKVCCSVTTQGAAGHIACLHGEVQCTFIVSIFHQILRFGLLTKVAVFSIRILTVPAFLHPVLTPVNNSCSACHATVNWLCRCQSLIC